ncbi:MAG: hypothetical protein ACE5HR_01575 [bacterium]
MRNKKPLVFQRLLWEESIEAVRQSLRFKDFKNFRRHLQEHLPQNSSYVRERYTRSIIRWFFPEQSLNNLLTKVWRSYNDTQILKDVMRYFYLEKEPVVAEFICKHLILLDPGTTIRSEYLKDFLIKKYGTVKSEPLHCLSAAIRDLGFTYHNKKHTIVRNLQLPKTGLLILVHYLLAPTPQTVALEEILAHKFWMCLGITNQSTVKEILKEADTKEMIAKYVVADQLEQITTRYTLDEFLQKRMKL